MKNLILMKLVKKLDSDSARNDLANDYYTDRTMIYKEKVIAPIKAVVGSTIHGFFKKKKLYHHNFFWHTLK